MRELSDQDEWTRGVRQLVYACGNGPVAFAFAADTFRFDGKPLDDRRPGNE